MFDSLLSYSGEMLPKPLNFCSCVRMYIAMFGSGNLWGKFNEKKI